MSRRKQSNPKPLKRKAEDEELEELAEQLHLPKDVLSLGEPSSETEDGGSEPDYTVQTTQKIKEGEQFGPYQGSVLKDSTKEFADQEQIETKDSDGHVVKISLNDVKCRWLKLTKSSSSYNSANFSIYSCGDKIWCRVKRDLEVETEIRTAYEGEKSFKSPSSGRVDTVKEDSNNRAKICRTSPQLVNADLSPKRDLAEDDGLEVGVSGSPKTFRSQIQSEKPLVNGDDDRKVKQEQVSPGSSSSPQATANPDFSKAPDTETYPDISAFPPYGFQPTAKVPQGSFVYVPFLPGQQMSPRPSSVSSVSSDQNEPKVLKAGFNCLPCGITFSSLRTLQAHQSFYCAHRTINLKKNEDGTNTENTHGRLKSRNHYIPRTRRATTVVNNETEDRSRSNQRNSVSEDLTVSDASNASESKSSQAGKTYLCNYCDYVTDRKGGLTRHIRTHGAEAGVQSFTLPSSPERISPTSSKDSASQRYCSNCEIQFSSQKTYQVHKVFYCNTRHVHKSTTPVPPISPTIPGTSQQPNIYETPIIISAGRMRSEKNLPIPVVVPQPMSPNSTARPTTGIDPKTGLVFGPPFYAAISTSPLILVPCSYLPGRGITPSAGGIVLPKGSASDDALSLSPVPRFAVVSNAGNPNRTDPRGVATPKVRPLTPKSETDVKVGESSSSVDKPLDLSLRKKGKDDETIAPSQSENVQPVGKVAVVIPSQGLGISAVPLNLCPETPATIIPPLEQNNPSVLVKQGTSRCKECNIVFFKHENYLVHKRMYCASRQNRNKRSSTSSPENGTVSPSPTKHQSNRGTKRRESNSSPARSAESSSPGGHSPKSAKCPSPGTAASPQIPTNSAGVISQQAIYQFYCLACGIKFTSLDNLRAHQTYYCPKRTVLAPHKAMLPVASPGSPREPESGLRCVKCKGYFPTEETLRCHPCGSQRKCPYCDVYCPTLSAAQRHLVTHTGVKAFRCTFCGYKGHTLRGMRTHIRIHMDSGSSVPEENYIICVGEDGTEVKTRKRSKAGSPPALESDTKSPGPATPNPDDPTNLDGVSTGPPGTPAQDVQHWCQYCGYTSSYKGNVVRHIKLVHRDVPVSPTGSSSSVSAAPSATLIKVPPNIPPAPTLTDTDVPISLVKKETSSPVASNATDSEHSNDSRVTSVTDKLDDHASTGHSSPGATRNNDGRESPKIKKEEGSSSSSTNTRSSSPNLSETANESGQGTSKRNGSTYCKICDISFKRLSNFIAHKEFYCNRPTPDTVVSQEPTTA